MKELEPHTLHKRAASDEKVPAKDQNRVTIADSDFTEWMVYDAEIPSRNSDVNDLGRRFDRMLTRAFEQMWKENGHENASRDVTLNAWDEYIFESIQEYGPLVLLSHAVIRRIFEWQRDENGIKKLKSLGPTLAKAAEIRHRSKKGRITSRHAHFKEFIVPEFAYLRSKLVTAWPKDAKGIIEFLSRELLRQDCSCANLARNHDSLIEFLRQNPDVAVRFRGTFKGGVRHIGNSDDIGPARMVHLWIAHSENRTEGSVKVELSRVSRRSNPL